MIKPRVRCKVVSEFWKAITTIQAERGGGYVAYPLFGAVYFAELGIAAAAVLLACRWYRRSGEAARRRALTAITAVLCGSEVLKQIVLAATGQWGWVYLPLHLCSIHLFVCLCDTLRPRRWLREELYALCLPGAVIALLLPGWQSVPVWNFFHLHSLLFHILLALYPALLLAGGFRPDPRRLPQSLAFLYGTALPIYFFNKRMHTNFYFLNEPYSNALTILFARWLGDERYFLAFVPLSVVVVAVMYLPWVRQIKRTT